MARFCTNCGSVLKDGALFCTNCGKPAEAEANAVLSDEVKTEAAATETSAAPAGETPEAKENAPASESAPAENAANDASGDEVKIEAPAAEAEAPSTAAPEAPAANAGSSSGKTLNISGITEKNIVLCIILSIVTCGIYGLIWMYRLNQEINQLADEPNATSGGIVILFTFISCGIYGWYWNYKMGERVDKIKGESNTNKVLFIILAICQLAIVNYAIMQDTINNSVRTQA